MTDMVCPPFEHEGLIFDLTVFEVAQMALRSATWVMLNADRLGGVKRNWDPHHEIWRFPSEGMDERIYEIQGEE